MPFTIALPDNRPGTAYAAVDPPEQAGDGISVGTCINMAETWEVPGHDSLIMSSPEYLLLLVMNLVVSSMDFYRV